MEGSELATEMEMVKQWGCPENSEAYGKEEGVAKSCLLSGIWGRISRRSVVCFRQYQI
jgi:hypothetical protein